MHEQKPRDFTVAEVEQLGRSLMPHFRLVMREELEPMRAEVANLKSKSRLWGAVTGALTAVGMSFLSR